MLFPFKALNMTFKRIMINSTCMLVGVVHTWTRDASVPFYCLGVAQSKPVVISVYNEIQPGELNQQGNN